ncbi:MAG: HAMP domain-containing histidine kinase [Calditrichaeota bacterium]|nr:HAMP domain-containing histidine kinase [Calditrichota bacterium]
MEKRKLQIVFALSLICFITIVFFQLSWFNQSLETLKQNKRQAILNVLQAASSYLDPGDDLTVQIEKLISDPDLPGSSQEKLKTGLKEKIDKAFAYSDHYYRYEPVIIYGKRFLLTEKNSSYDYLAVPLQFSVSHGRPIQLAIQLYDTDISLVDFPLQLILPIIFILILFLLFVYLLKYSFDQYRYQKMQSDFTNSMLHELKTPVFSISLAVKSLMQRFSSQFDDKQSQYLNIIETETTRLKAHVESVLQQAILDNKPELSVIIEQVNLSKMLTEVILQCETIYAIRIKQDISIDQIILADPLHLRNILINLLDNAVKYSEQTADIRITLFVADNHCQLTISDHGIGISKNDLSHIFDKFYRVKRGDVHKINGFGLGLNYVKKIVDLHSWKITVQSEIGDGTTVRLEIPC